MRVAMAAVVALLVLNFADENFNNGRGESFLDPASIRWVPIGYAWDEIPDGLLVRQAHSP